MCRYGQRAWFKKSAKFVLKHIYSCYYHYCFLFVVLPWPMHNSYAHVFYSRGAASYRQHQVKITTSADQCPECGRSRDNIYDVTTCMFTDAYCLYTITC